MGKRKIELYFHIPFCARKCRYCDFLSSPADPSVRDAYMEALLKETEERASEYQEYIVDTVFIGGGTPSVVDALWIERLLKTVYGEYSVSEEAEITIEVNPGTVDEEKLKCYLDAGINRLSIGLQSGDDKELELLGRIHTWKDFCETYRLARKVGFCNINVDVMSALPGQSRESYSGTLEKILNIQPQPEHISAYSLIVEDGTPFAEMQEKGLLHLPEEEDERWMYEHTAETLKSHGYVRYEISNYAKEGYECRHNCGYWKRTDYVGFGIGAASLVNNERFRNDDSLQEYIENPLGRRCDLQVIGTTEQMEEFMFLGLRMTEGVSEREFRAIYGKSMEEVYDSVIRKNVADGLLRYIEIAGCDDSKCEKDKGSDRRLALTAWGTDVCNYVMAQFLFD